MHIISKIVRFQGELQEPKSVLFIGLLKKDVSMLSKQTALAADFHAWASVTDLVVMPVRNPAHLEELANALIKAKYGAVPSQEEMDKAAQKIKEQIQATKALALSPELPKEPEDD